MEKITIVVELEERRALLALAVLASSNKDLDKVGDALMKAHGAVYAACVKELRPSELEIVNRVGQMVYTSLTKNSVNKNLFEMSVDGLYNDIRKKIDPLYPENE